ncbi:thioredoxin family protein [Leptolyngbya sp. NK1-12]|uniref:Thioredoxin family protein n=1 Tax=Leptolyngbya sp. NK1-12 TaxID=2547451 RepID=A0AA96WHX3_9CYAN|nr:thioredoxin family protein [Leptolyngbya sp. NK1-12]WNZ22611.1 thioredoxin family protein [Leptolyngbya sp. NK1-12]
MGISGTTIGSYAPDFEIPGIDGAVHHLARYLERFRAVGVIVMCNHCPYVQMYLARLAQIQVEFAEQGFTLIGINANDESQFPADSFEQMKSFAVEQRLNFPYLRDVTQDVARSFGAECTPQAFLIDQTGVLRYSGAIDDNPQHPGAVKHSYLRDAITQLLSGNEIVTTLTTPVGCSVKWRLA